MESREEGNRVRATNTVFPPARVPFTDNELGFVSLQSSDLSLEQFNISLELLKNKRDLSAVRLGPEKWLRQKVVFRFKKWKRIISLIIFEMKQRELRDGASQVLRQEKVVGEKFRLYGEK